MNHKAGEFCKRELNMFRTGHNWNTKSAPRTGQVDVETVDEEEADHVAEVQRQASTETALAGKNQSSPCNMFGSSTALLVTLRIARQSHETLTIPMGNGR
ncbi:hypothetical protein MJO28_013602 [Puccinia striiformis f. sp. tritici]|uniref:Uncharacterized protein n=1 Tax=Puccinia striiformis f. sp. tritici TaxID=168172 RepID=A0ACC0DW05_9BASI|nr:hypothetical protein Pst134EA_025875 [Puccinia striiformis f. sp. tritici]KAH9444059.1 hypothetical protein Pst134EB_026446 [Puccinia striiformis f. sp. tritici]KAH9451937.1 hypothetical protein Pst134EA_025875 [Puccinia striiformis f. sp. tritici]KAI7939950.1 hypothetical protein MJO28_013602 [Puccinia striiformis f. sp. tritici]